jgi:CRISPR-associated endonuclease/helicase Cas3
MNDWRVDHFNAFYEAVHGYTPFLWQQDLVTHILDTGSWPPVLDVPTGLGKTSLIDIAVFVAAATGAVPGGAGRRRVFFAIDRRIVVDEATLHAEALADALRGAQGSDTAVGRVAQALNDLHGADDWCPLKVTRMRGGITWSWRWLDRPDRPAVVVGTVDQVGSRLLFGGYGISRRLRPIDAALVGTDSIVIVDEAHLARPFVETLGSLASTPVAGRLPVSAPIVVTMSATPSSDAPASVAFPQVLRDAEESPEAARRLHASKGLHGVVVPKNVAPEPVLARYAADLFDPDGGVSVVGVVCNTVARARKVHELLTAELDGVPVELLTGRVRPVDRDRIVEQVVPIAGVDRHRRSEGDDAPASPQPMVLVATQTIEVGANLDFEALVTESAPIDALVQRIGRLHRLGRPDGSTRTCVVVHHEQPQPLYGEARDATWRVLAERIGDVPAATARRVPPLGASIDASPFALRELLADVELDSLTVDPPETPALLPEQLADWAATSVTPLADLDPFLHGLREDQNDVAVVWRADLPCTDWELDGASQAELWQAQVDRLPPVAGEQLEVPIGRLRRFALGEPGAGEVADVASAELPPEDDAATRRRREEPTETEPLYALIWRGRGDGELVDLRSRRDWRRIRPGDVLVLSAAARGCDRWGWAPTSTAPVDDVAEIADGERTVVRVDPRTLPAWLGLGPGDPRFDRLVASLVELLGNAGGLAEEDLDVAVAEALGPFLDELGGLGEERLSALLAGDVVRRYRAQVHDPANPNKAVKGTALDVRIQAKDVARLHAMTDGSERDDDPAGSSLSQQAVTLEKHQAAVAERARSVARTLGLPDEVAESVALAAGFHDLGKADPRFQTMLHGGDRAAAEAGIALGEPLAKSGMDPNDRDRRRRAFRASGLPRGYRHEGGSAQAVAAVLDGRDGIDAELVVHLVAAHHGNARPLLPAVEDLGKGLGDGKRFSVKVGVTEVCVEPTRSVDLAHPARFRRLSERYGHWGLALLETIVRMADIGCSEEGT